MGPQNSFNQKPAPKNAPQANVGRGEKEVSKKGFFSGLGGEQRVFCEKHLTQRGRGGKREDDAKSGGGEQKPKPRETSEEMNRSSLPKGGRGET